MNAMTLPIVLAVVLVATAVAGPALLRAAAPILMRVPRFAVLLLAGSLALWFLAGGSLSLLVAWFLRGPTMLPGAAGDVCQRCLDAASPFVNGAAGVETAVPVMLLVTLPAALVLALLGFGVVRWVRRSTQVRREARRITALTRPGRVAGHEVRVLDLDRPVAFSLGTTAGGIVVSDGLTRDLTLAELAAVIEHERAHLHQRHHLVLAAIDALVHPLRWLPLARAVADAVPHYLEIAADNAARSQAGTTALASALLKMGAPLASLQGAEARLVGALHIAGPDRIGQLVAPHDTGRAVLPTWALGAQVIAFAVVAAAVHVPYLLAFATGCPLPA